eukprot:m.545870 g.545870  ORF g.545870 m.545870 type:complete len:522 (+) comp57676_c1_seq7:1027-2592(+)
MSATRVYDDDFPALPAPSPALKPIVIPKAARPAPTPAPAAAASADDWSTTAPTPFEDWGTPATAFDDWSAPAAVSSTTAAAQAAAAAKISPCAICSEEYPSYQLHAAIQETGAGHYTKNTCGHVFCRACLEGWVTTAIRDYIVKIGCPQDGCNNLMYPDDVGRFAPADLHAQHMKRISANFSERLGRQQRVDPSFLEFVQKEAKTCPVCHVILIRSDGCNMMRCTCGTDFCYGCSKVQCVCCYVCGGHGHSPSKCPDRTCFRCGAKGHSPMHCPELPECETCGRRGHTGQNCRTRCFHCREAGHVSRDCPTYICEACGRRGHAQSACRSTCRLCHEVGHSKDHCPQAECSHCGDRGHSRKACQVVTSGLASEYQSDFPELGQRAPATPRASVMAASPAAQAAVVPAVVRPPRTASATPQVRAVPTREAAPRPLPAAVAATAGRRLPAPKAAASALAPVAAATAPAPAFSEEDQADGWIVVKSASARQQPVDQPSPSASRPRATGSRARESAARGSRDSWRS